MGTPQIILLPGLDGDGFYFAGLSRALGPYPCRTLSYPSHLSDLTDLCEWVCSELDTETDCVLMGESFGGPLALLVAEALGDQAKGLVLCATFCRAPLLRFNLFAAALLYPLVIRFKWMAHFLNFFAFNGSDLPLAIQLHRALKAVPARTIPRRIRMLCGLDLRPEASALTLPCLVVRASHDRLVKSGDPGNLPLNGTVVTIDGPHELSGTRTLAVAKAISDFIKTKI